MKLNMRMNRWLMPVLIVLSAGLSASCGATFDSARALQGGAKALQAATLSDAQLRQYVAASVAQMDKQNTVLGEKDAYTVRLKKLTKGLTEVDGVPLNFKVYKTSEANAFACADGSVRVYTGLMDIMTDDQVLGVIGHEIGHVALKHSKKEYKTALLASAASDAIGAAGGVIGAISDAGLGSLGEAIVNAQYSKKQESAADDYGYKFLKAAGRNPWAIALAFEQLKKLSSSSNSKQSAAVNRLFSSHPDLDSRIERMSAKAVKDGYARP